NHGSRHSCQVVIWTTNFRLARPILASLDASKPRWEGRKPQSCPHNKSVACSINDGTVHRRRRSFRVLRFGSEFAVHCKRPRSHSVHQAFQVPARLARGGLYSFRRFQRACAAFACLVVALIAVLPTLVFTFLALVGAVWIKQFF